jgi:hypothetical protein
MVGPIYCTRNAGLVGSKPSLFTPASSSPLRPFLDIPPLLDPNGVPECLYPGCDLTCPGWVLEVIVVTRELESFLLARLGAATNTSR